MMSASRVWLFAACVAIFVVQGWLVLKVHSIGVWLLYFGLVGAIPFMVLNGVHGDTEGALGVIGGVLYVITNGAVYYGLIRLFLSLRERRQQKRSKLVG